MSQFPAIIDLSALDGTDGFRLDGASAGDISALSVAGIGDFNGDGLGDIIIGAYRAGPNGDYSGAAYVVFGTTAQRASALQLSALSPGQGFVIAGAHSDDQLGRSVSSAGDVNGDGFADLIVGAPGGDAGGEYSNSGTSYVIFGRAAGLANTFDLSALNGKNGFQLIGGKSAGEWNDQSGRSVASAGDINGDGLADLIVGAYRADPNGTFSGSSYVVFGHRGSFSATIDLATLDGNVGFRIDGEVPSANATVGYSAGYSIASAGDINGDGFDDLMVGAYRASHSGAYSGSTYVVFGRPQGFGPVLELGDLNGKNGFRIDGAEAKDRSGRSIASAGDINGDGYADMAIGAMLASPSSNAAAGSTYIVLGNAQGFASSLDLGTLNGVNGFRIDGVKARERSGVSVASAGDVNGDGFGDLIIGAYYANPNGENSGTSYVIFGKASGFGSAINLSILNGSNGFRIDGVSDYDQSGRAVSAAGDVNGDGLGDLLVGAPGASRNGEMSGSSYIIFGSKPIVPVVRTGSNSNQTLAGGDQADTLDGKGGDDVLYGHSGADTIYGGLGRDAVDGGDGNDSLSGGTGRDTMSAGFGDDTVSGDEENDIIGGGLGNDLIAGGTGADRMFGADGDDNFNSGPGKDSIAGGAGHDRFFFTSASWGGDQIVDFEDGLDILRFKTIVADDVKDFTIMGNGTNDVTLAIGTQTLQLHSLKPIFISNDDFQFFT